jgi:hypothetical protein
MRNENMIEPINPQCVQTDVSKSVLCTIYENIEHYKDYLKLRIDIIANNPNRWLGNSKMQLPTFEYYLKNCVNDKGGKYDFTKRNYSTPSQVLEPISFHSQNKYAMNSKRLYRNIIHSMWMGTPFNYETVVETVC